jgi:hypothetical protein
MVTNEGGRPGEDWYARWKCAEAALRRQLEEEQRNRPSRIPLPHVHMIDVIGLWEEQDGVERRVGHQAKCAFQGCGWSARPHTGEDLDAAWAGAKADRDEHQREVLRAHRLDR